MARALALFGVGLALAAPASATPVRMGHLSADLVADRTAAAPGQTIHIALRQSIDDGWHTYWRNPGDSGQATTLDWTLPAGWHAGPIIWPAPSKLPVGPLLDYGYSGEVLLPVELAAGGDARAGSSATVKAHVALLVCKDVCVPEDANLTLTMPVVPGPPPVDGRWGPPIAATLAAAPRPSSALKAALTPANSVLKLSIVGAPAMGAEAAYFFPYDGEAIEAAPPQTIDRGPRGLTLMLSPGSAFKTGAPPSAISGVLTIGQQVFEVTAPQGPPLAGAGGLGPPTSPASLGAIAFALAGAFVGGLILNLMPCVFPVLAMKASALVGHAHEPARARRQAVAYLAGVVLSFLALGGALVAARAAGQAVGWGFQLQSPPVLAAFALVMLLVALDLSGVFEAGGGVQALAGRAGPANDTGAVRAAFTGVLAVAVAAPCTAPFMGAAIGFALTQGAVVALGVFLALGLGMAALFVALAFAPGLLRLLPRPGPWMEGLKKFLAFPMYATAAWLAWVYAESAGADRLVNLLAAAVLVALAAWLYGASQRARAVGRRGAAPELAGGAAALALGLAVVFWPPPVTLTAQPYSPERLAALRVAHRPVFVNFTAAWCVTCQVNDRIALSGDQVASAFGKAGVVYLKGDWTDRNAMIEQALAEHGRAGVPLYLMYPANGGDAEVLPQILTEGAVVDAAKRAAN